MFSSLAIRRCCAEEADRHAKLRFGWIGWMEPAKRNFMDVKLKLGAILQSVFPRRSVDRQKSVERVKRPIVDSSSSLSKAKTAVLFGMNKGLIVSFALQ